jgi:putative ABC transport system permease protein
VLLWTIMDKGLSFIYAPMMHFSETRQILRRLWKNRGFSATVVLTLGLGVGATVSVFSIIYAVMITPLPYPDPARLVSVFQSKIANDQADLDGFSPANFVDFRQQEHVFTDLAASCGFHYTLTGHGDPRHLSGVAASPGLFATLGVKPMLGRSFLPDAVKPSSLVSRFPS